jgi:excisionase family DNA binding protein
MQYTLGSAARMAGLSKSTLSRAIKDGKLTAVRSDDTGSYKIEQSELERYQAAAVAVSRATAENHSAPQAATQQEHHDIAVLQTQMDGMQRLLSFLQAQLHDTQQQRDSWQRQAERLGLPRPTSPAAGTGPAIRPATVSAPQLAAGLALLSNPLAQVWSWLADLGRATVSKPTAPANLARFGHGCLAPGSEPRRSEAPQPLNREALLRELARELERDGRRNAFPADPRATGHRARPRLHLEFTEEHGEQAAGDPRTASLPSKALTTSETIVPDVSQSPGQPPGNRCLP